MIFDAINRNSLLAVGKPELIRFAAYRAENLSGKVVGALKASLDSFFVRLLVNGYSRLVQALCHIKEIRIYDLKIRAFAQDPLFFRELIPNGLLAADIPAAPSIYVEFPYIFRI